MRSKLSARSYRKAEKAGLSKPSGNIVAVVAVIDKEDAAAEATGDYDDLPPLYLSILIRASIPIHSHQCKYKDKKYRFSFPSFLKSHEVMRV